uniref:(northern house mosquito) hypothetical protein n=1 Tax=Culex pipiens TaxID=7175 RepID=A0A8D8BK55_CULPI
MDPPTDDWKPDFSQRTFALHDAFMQERLALRAALGHRKLGGRWDRDWLPVGGTLWWFLVDLQRQRSCDLGIYQGRGIPRRFPAGMCLVQRVRDQPVQGVVVVLTWRPLVIRILQVFLIIPTVQLVIVVVRHKVGAGGPPH